MPGFKSLTNRSGFEPGIWIALSALLLLGTISTLITFLHLPTAQTLYANEHGQRAVIDTVTGTISLSAFTAEKKPEFEVGDEDTKPAEEPPHPGEAPPSEEHAATAVQAGEHSPDGLPVLRTEPLANGPIEAAASQDSLVAAPAPEVSEKTGEGTLPKRNGETTPAKVYARRFTRTPDQHLLSIVILDTGLSPQSLPLIMGLPKEITLAFSPYTPDAEAKIAAMRRAGFEVWSMLPAQGAHYPQDDPGPLGLVVNLPKDEAMRRLHEIMKATLGAVGVVLPPDEALSAKGESFSPIIAELDARGLNVLSTNQTRTAAQVTGGKELQSPVRRTDVLLDPVPDEAAIEKKLNELIPLMAAKENIVVVTSARPQTLLVLQKWFHDHPLTAPEVLAPLSAHWLPKEAAPPPEAEKSEGGHGEAKPEKKDEKKSEGGHE